MTVGCHRIAREILLLLTNMVIQVSRLIEAGRHRPTTIPIPVKAPFLLLRRRSCMKIELITSKYHKNAAGVQELIGVV